MSDNLQFVDKFRRRMGRRLRQTLGSSDQAEASTLWSALTCQRFGRSRLVATTFYLRLSQRMRRQDAADQSGDRSPHSKELTT